MTLSVVLERDDVHAGDDNRPWPMEFPTDARVSHVVATYVQERYLPRMDGCAWLVRQLAGEWSRDVALLVSLEHPEEPLVLNLGYSAGRDRLDVERFRDGQGRFVFRASYHPLVGPMSLAAYGRWADG